MAKPAIFFDRDNTLIINDGYLGDPDGVRLMPGAAAAITTGRAMGFAIVTVSNQSGVARGLFDESAVQAVNRRMDQLLIAENPAAKIDLHLYCPYHPQAVVAAYRSDSELRKPRPGMILLAAKNLDLDLKQSWLIGDAPRDIHAGRAAGVRTILFKPPGIPVSPEATDESSADFETNTLEEAMDYINHHRA